MLKKPRHVSLIKIVRYNFSALFLLLFLLACVLQLPKLVHRSPIWHMKDNGQSYCFLKGCMLFIVLVKALEALEDGGKSLFLKYLSKHFLAKLKKFKDSFNTTLYLLDFIGF